MSLRWRGAYGSIGGRAGLGHRLVAAWATRGSGRRLVMGRVCLLSDGGRPSVSCVTRFRFVSFVRSLFMLL